MCGIAGYAGMDEPGLLSEMASRILHRGPDDGGTWWDSTAGVGLAHRRLSIIDTSPAGHQPMTAGEGTTVVLAVVRCLDEAAGGALLDAASAALDTQPTRIDVDLRALDDRSLNGLLVNGERVEWATLRDGDELEIGRYRLYVLEA